MSYKCVICCSNDVDSPGCVCELCAIGQDPYAESASENFSDNQLDSSTSNSGSHSPKRSNSRKLLLNGGANLTNQDPYGNDISTTQSTDSSVQVYAAGQAVQQQSNNTDQNLLQSPDKTNTGNHPITEGITKNITVDNQKKSFISKWFRSIIKGVPFTLDNDITMFQVFPDYSGVALNAMGNACDQVIVYGRLNNGAISENNDVEVYGRRDSDNNVIAKTIKNKASGTTISPMRTISAGVVRVVTTLLIALLTCACVALGTTGLIWVGVIILCLLNLPLILKIIGGIIGIIFTMLRRNNRRDRRRGR